MAFGLFLKDGCMGLYFPDGVTWVKSWHQTGAGAAPRKI